MCRCVFCVCDTENYLHSGLKRGFFSLLINIQCDSSLSFPCHSRSDFPHRPSSPTASSPTSLPSTITPSLFPFLSLSLPLSLLLAFSSNPIRSHSGNTLSRRIRYSRFLRTFVARESLFCSRSAGFRPAFVQTDDVGGKIRAPFVEKSLRPRRVHPGRALRKIQNFGSIGVDGTGRELLRSLGTRQSNSEGAIRDGSRRKREADPDKTLEEDRCRQSARGTYAKAAAAATAAATPRSSRDSR